MRYVFRGGQFVDPNTNEPMPLPEGDGVVMPMIQSDIQPYYSPCDGRLIGSRSARREDLARNNCVPYEPIGNMPKGLKNPRFAKKHGLEHMLTEEVRDQHKIRIRK